MTAPVAAETKGTKKNPAPGEMNRLGKRERLLSEYTQHQNDRSSFLSLWKDLNKYLFTARGRFLTTDHLKGDRRSKDSLDITPQLAARTCAAGIATGVTNAAREWFRLGVADPDLAERPRVVDWLHTVSTRMRAVLLGSNFYRCMHTMYGDMAGYGTSPVLIEEDAETVLRCYPFPIGSYVVGTDASGRVNYFAHEWRMTVRQLVTEYGYDQCSPTVQSAWQRGGAALLQWFEVVRVIYPNPEYNAGLLASKYKRFASCTFEKAVQNGHDAFLRESGYDEFPVVVGRWDSTAEDSYGTDCPGISALADIKGLQHGRRRTFQALDKLVNPPLVAPGSMQNFPVTQLPGGVNFVDDQSGKGMRPLHEVDPKMNELLLIQQDIREIIREAFFADLFRMSSYLDEGTRTGQPKTAAEIHERREEKLMQLGPMLHNLDDDVYNPGIDRVFAIMVRRGLIPPAPDELEGQDLKVEYLSIMHQAQKSAGLGSLERYALFKAQLIAASEDPAAGDKFNDDEAMEEYGEMAGVSPNVIRTDDEVAAMRQSRAQAAQAAQRAEIMKAEAAAAKDLSETDVSGDNALTAALAGQAQVAGVGGVNG